MFIKWQTMVEKQLNLKVKCLQIDLRGEGFSNETVVGPWAQEIEVCWIQPRVQVVHTNQKMMISEDVKFNEGPPGSVCARCI